MYGCESVTREIKFVLLTFDKQVFSSQYYVSSILYIQQLYIMHCSITLLVYSVYNYSNAAINNRLIIWTLFAPELSVKLDLLNYLLWASLDSSVSFPR